MFKIIGLNCAKSTNIVSNCVQKRFASNVSRSFLQRNRKKAIFIGGLTSLIAYDYVASDLEIVGGGVRFMRSIKIAALISIDYSYNLWGLQSDSEEYNKVRSSFSDFYEKFLDFELKF
jgi:hypothetical protein